MICAVRVLPTNTLPPMVVVSVMAGSTVMSVTGMTVLFAPHDDNGIDECYIAFSIVIYFDYYLFSR